MSPTIVAERGEVRLVLGGSGEGQAATAVAEVLLAQTVFGRSATQAVSDLRIHAPPTGGLRVEPEAPPELVEDLRRRGELVFTSPPSYSAVGLIAALRMPDSGVLLMEAAADPRRDGKAVVE
ncbi:MAG: gamma-glutamyltransferase [Deltaproteobacteria bacterium]|nr:gamma-glutamyltransferase [Deltaproteobacteria bacterium]